MAADAALAIFDGLLEILTFSSGKSRTARLIEGTAIVAAVGTLGYIGYQAYKSHTQKVNDSREAPASIER